MLVKVVGEYDGLYAEQTYEHVLKHRVANCPKGMDMSNGDVYSGGKNPFTRLTLIYSRDNAEFEYVYFNTVAYLMQDDGRTIDVLKFDKLER
jgi:hypothetical protein